MLKSIKKVFGSSISLKIIFSLGVTIAIILLLFTYLLFQIQKSEILKRTESYNYIISRLIYQHIEKAMLSGEKEKIEDVLKDLVRSPEILEANVLDNENRVRFSSNPELVGHLTGHRSGTLLEKSFSMTTPVKNKEACQKCHGKDETIGMLQINISSSSMQKDLAKNRNLMLIFGLTILAGISTVITILTMKLLNKPLIHLMNAMDKVGKGDLSARADITKDDEIGRLGKHFNSMIVRMEDTKMELEEYRQRQLKEFDKLASLGKVAAGVAHEINNPLDSLQSCLARVKKSLNDRKDLNEYLEWMRLSIHRIDIVVKRLLDFAKPHKPVLKPIEISDIIDEVLSLIDYKAKKTDVIIQKEFTDSVTVNGDRHLLQEVFFNLAINAVESMPDGGTLKFKGYHDSNKAICIEVEDTGTGIKESELNKVFEPFYTTKEDTGGTGLGLSICLDIIKQHDGTIEVKSSKGKGTTFLISLPAIKE